MSESESKPPPKTTHRRILLMGGMSLEQQTRTSNELSSTLLADYEGNMSLWNVPLEYLAAFKRFFAGGWREMEDKISIAEFTFNPLEGEPILPANLTQQRSEDYQLWLFQMVGPAKNEWWQQLRDAGVTVLGHVSNEMYQVWVNGEQLRKLEAMVSTTNFIRWTGSFHPYYKLLWELHPKNLSPNSETVYKVTVGFHGHPNVAKSVQKLPVPPRFSPSTTNSFSIKTELTVPQLIEVANLPDVLFIEPQYEDELFDEAQGQIVAGNVTTDPNNRVVPLPPSYLNWLVSQGFLPNSDAYPIIGIYDSGIDTIDGNTKPYHSDFFFEGNKNAAYRIITSINCTNDSGTNDHQGHGTMVASIIAGFNNSSGVPNYKDSRGYSNGLGISPYNRLVNIKIIRDTGTPPPFDKSNCPSEIDEDEGVVARGYAEGVRISSNSWGANVSGRYTARARNYDRLTRDASTAIPGNQQMLHIFAAGNTGYNGLYSLGDPGAAKNVLTVGASEGVREDGTPDGCNWTKAGNADNVADFSSRGPTRDGRIKPDLVAPGSHIIGAASQDDNFSGIGVCGGIGGTNPITSNYYPITQPQQQLYTWSRGTSFSAPAVAGAASLTYNYYKRVLKPGFDPSPAMLKALLLNSTRYMRGIGGNDNLPSNNQGWGSVNLNNLFDTSYTLYDQETTFTTVGQTFVKTGTVVNSSKPLRITLVWTDAPGNVTVQPVQIPQNDLDLEVTINGQVYKGNFFNKEFSVAGGNADTLNNVESVFLPAGTSGQYSVKVRATTLRGVGVPGTAIPGNNQDFALVIYNGSVSSFTTPLLGQGPIATTDAAPGGNGNSTTEPAETIAMTIPLLNQGTQTATNISSSLVSNDTNIVLVSADSAYPDMPVNTPANGVNNTTPFRFGVKSGLSCGTSLNFSQVITYNSGANVRSVTTPFSLRTGTPTLGTAITRAKTGSEPISDYNVPRQQPGSLTSILNVAAPGTIGKVKLTINIEHEAVGDLGLSLMSPAGNRITLLEENENNAGANFTNTSFDDSAILSIENIETSGAPFTHSYRPLQALAGLAGTPINGEWKLLAYDNRSVNTGTLLNWTLEIQPATYSCAPFSPQAATIEISQGNNQSTAVTTNFAQSLQVTVRDRGGSPMNGVPVKFTAPVASDIIPPSGTFPGGVTEYSTTTNDNGQASAATLTANVRSGTFNLTATFPSASTPATFVLTNLPGAPASMSIVQGNNQQTAVNTAFATLLEVRLFDQHGNSVRSGHTVQFAAPTGSNIATGTFPGNAATYSVATGNDGKAKAIVLTANSRVGTFTVNATAAGVNTPATFQLSNRVGPPAAIRIHNGNNQRAIVSTVYTGPLEVSVVDSGNNPVADAVVVFNAPLFGPSVTFVGTSKSYMAQTNAQGIASSVNPRANTAANLNPFSVAASLRDNSALSIDFSLQNVAAPGTVLVLVSGSPQGADVNTPFPSPLQLQLTDSYGNGTNDKTVTFTAPTSGASGTFGGSNIVALSPDSDGYAQAPAFTANGIVGNYQVTASLPSGALVKFDLKNLASCGAGFNHALVTVATDSGEGEVCGSLSRALLQSGSGVTITFSLEGTDNKVNIGGALPPVQAGVTLRGTNCTGGLPGITLHATNTAAGATSWFLKGGVTLQNLRISGLKLAAQAGSNRLVCVEALK